MSESHCSGGRGQAVHYRHCQGCRALLVPELFTFKCPSLYALYYSSSSRCKRVQAVDACGGAKGSLLPRGYVIACLCNPNQEGMYLRASATLINPNQRRFTMTSWYYQVEPGEGGDGRLDYKLRIRIGLYVVYRPCGDTTTTPEAMAPLSGDKLYQLLEACAEHFLPVHYAILRKCGKTWKELCDRALTTKFEPFLAHTVRAAAGKDGKDAERSARGVEFLLEVVSRRGISKERQLQAVSSVLCIPDIPVLVARILVKETGFNISEQQLKAAVADGVRGVEVWAEAAAAMGLRSNLPDLLLRIAVCGSGYMAFADTDTEVSSTGTPGNPILG